jgi:hypothetical protein
MMLPRRAFWSVAGLLLLGLLVWTVVPSQDADPNFQPRIVQPAFTDRAPIVVIDDDHFNAHTSAGRYRPLATLPERDGFRILAGASAVTPDALARADVFVKLPY